MTKSPIRSIADIQARILTGQMTITENIRTCLQNIEQHNPSLNCFTDVVNDRAIRRAVELDAMLQRGENPGPLTGIPFAVKNLFDIEGIVTLAGSLINAADKPAGNDAVLIERLESTGAILVGALAMGEYAYDFTGENSHYGACRNPWNTQCMSGGSSSGSGSAVGAGLVPLALGSDTNGSIRVPSSLCGLFGLKPTYGRLPRTGSFPFCDSLDHLGPLALCTRDLALAFDAMQGNDSGDHACSSKQPDAVLPALEKGCEGLKLARASGYFDCSNYPDAQNAVNHVCDGLGVTQSNPLIGANEGRSAAYLITNAESATLHRGRLLGRVKDFDPDTRDRFLAGSLFPATWYIRAQQVRRIWLEQMLDVFSEVDAIIAPCTPCTAPAVGTTLLEVNGKQVPLRPNLGLFTQPFSAIGLPVCSVPIWTSSNGMPIGVQIVAAPGREDICLRVARTLEASGAAASYQPAVFAA